MLVDKQSGEIFLYQPIGADFFGEGITSETIIQALDQLGGKRAIVRINSPGGSVFDGIAIYNALKRYPGGVDVVVDALAASIASIIALAGETRTSAKGSMWMIHRAMTFAFGNQEEIQRSLSALETADRTLVSIYSDVMRLSQREIDTMMSAETWFTAEEAVAVGLATKTDGIAKQSPKAAAWFMQAPAAIKTESGRNSPKVPVYRYVSPFSKQ